VLHEMEWSVLGKRDVVGSCKCSDVSLGSIKSWEIS
jgi:hypothetical protein